MFPTAIREAFCFTRRTLLRGSFRKDLSILNSLGCFSIRICLRRRTRSGRHLRCPFKSPDAAKHVRALSFRSRFGKSLARSDSPRSVSEYVDGYGLVLSRVQLVMRAQNRWRDIAFGNDSGHEAMVTVECSPAFDCIGLAKCDNNYRRIAEDWTVHDAPHKTRKASSRASRSNRDSTKICDASAVRAPCIAHRLLPETRLMGASAKVNERGPLGAARSGER